MEAFTTRAEAAYLQAQIDAAPFVPSMAQIEASMQPFVDEVVAMSESERKTYVYASFNPTWGPCRIAFDMVKRAI
jgi:hypothetical protein